MVKVVKPTHFNSISTTIDYIVKSIYNKYNDVYIIEKISVNKMCDSDMYYLDLNGLLHPFNMSLCVNLIDDELNKLYEYDYITDIAEKRPNYKESHTTITNLNLL